MSDNLDDSTARLKQLVERIMKETDPVQYDEIGCEIWRALSERERLMKQTSLPVKRVVKQPSRTSREPNHMTPYCDTPYIPPFPVNLR
jgi:hypothetical protein